MWEKFRIGPSGCRFGVIIIRGDSLTSGVAHARDVTAFGRTPNATECVSRRSLPLGFACVGTHAKFRV